MTSDATHGLLRRAVAHLAVFGVVSLAYMFGLLDFSSHSTQPGNTALAEALAAAEGHMVLLVFAQMARRAGGSERLVLTRPLPEFERNSVLGSVNAAWSYSAGPRRRRSGRDP